jgi:hypothetical protein
LTPRREDAPIEAGDPARREGVADTADAQREQREALDAGEERGETADDVSLRPLARALLALAEQLSQEEGP